MAAVTLTLRLSAKPRMGMRTLWRHAAWSVGDDAVALVAEHDRRARQRREVGGEQVALGVGGDELVAGCGERGDGLGHVGVGAHVDPALRAARDRVGREEALDPLHDVEALHAEGVAGADDRRAVVRIMGGVHDDRHGVNPGGDHGAQPLGPLGAHERLEHAGDRGRVEVGQRGEELPLLLRDERAVGGGAAHGATLLADEPGATQRVRARICQGTLACPLGISRRASRAASTGAAPRPPRSSSRSRAASRTCCGRRRSWRAFDFASVTERSASATRDLLATKWLSALPAALPSSQNRVELLGELGEQLVHDLGDEAGLDALHGVVTRLDGEPREASLGGHLLVDERARILDDGRLLLRVVDRVGQAHDETPP